MTKRAKAIECACGAEAPLPEGMVLPNGWWAGPDGNGEPTCARCVSRTLGWIGVDWDGTLVTYDGWLGAGIYGAWVMPMVRRVKEWLRGGKLVKVMTARAIDPVEVAAIRAACLREFGVELPVTDRKDYLMEELWDDRAVGVEPNTGRIR